MDIKERLRQGEKGLRQVERERCQAGGRRGELRHLLFPHTGVKIAHKLLQIDRINSFALMHVHFFTGENI